MRPARNRPPKLVPHAQANLRLKAGDSIAFSLNFSDEGPAVLPPLGDDGKARLKLNKRSKNPPLATSCCGSHWLHAPRLS